MSPRPPLSRPGARKSLALVGAGALIMLAAAPGSAAEPVAQADATGLVLTVASTPTDSGTYSVSDDGTGEVSTGSNEPLITALGGQSFINAGTLAQDAETTITNRNGSSAACAGLAGDNATLVSVAEGSCLIPGDNATINAGTIDLTDLTVVQADLLSGLDAQLQALLQPLLNAVLPAVSDGLEQALTALGDLGVSLDLGAVQSQCTAAIGTADGDTQITDADLSIEVAGTNVSLLQLPTNPPPNTKLLTNLDVVVDAILDAVQTEVDTALGGVLDPLGAVLDPLQAALVDQVLAAIAPQLAPLEENLLDVTLNKQVRPTDDSIEVTALDLRLLPAAADFGVDLLNLEIGRTSCGPSGRVGAPPTDEPTTPTDEPTTSDSPTPAVPTSVPAGLFDNAGGSSDGAVNGRIATGAIVLMTMLAAIGGTMGFRRVLRS